MEQLSEISHSTRAMGDRTCMWENGWKRSECFFFESASKWKRKIESQWFSEWVSEFLLLVFLKDQKGFGYNRNERRRMVQQSESERERALPPSLSSKMYLFVVVACWDSSTQQCKFIDTARSANPFLSLFSFSFYNSQLRKAVP